MKFVYSEGATPIDPDEAHALIPTHITTQKELNEWESQNIQQAVTWGLSRKKTGVLTVDFVRELHRQMFDHTWEWAGSYRMTDKNIGAPCELISVEVLKLVQDADFWITESVFTLQESATRLHHRMVSIHPFVNGNGRHARLLADIFLFNSDVPRIQWGGPDLDNPGEVRTKYLAALRAADEGDYSLLNSYF